jgi:integrase
LETGGYVESTKLTVGEFLERWLRDYVSPNLAPRTAEGYEHIIRRHLVPGLGAIHLSQLTPQHVQAYYSERIANGRLDGNGGLSARSVRHHHRTLHDALQHALKWGLVAHNVTQAVDAPRFKNHEMRTLDAKGVHEILEATRGTSYHPLFHTAVFTGMRRSELLGLRWRNVDLDMCTISVSQVMHHLRTGEFVIGEPKSKKSRRLIDLPPSTAVILRRWKEQLHAERVLLGTQLSADDLVFGNPDGSPLLPDTVTHAWVKLVRRLGYAGVRLHDARHTHATLMLQQGVHPKVVQERLGHSSIQVTLDTYSHVTPGIQRAAAMRFDEGMATQLPDPEPEAAFSST